MLRTELHLRMAEQNRQRLDRALAGTVEVCPQPVDPTSDGLDPDGTFPLDICVGNSDSEVGR